MHRIFKKDLQLTDYKKPSWHLISSDSKKKRLDRGKTILTEVKRTAKKALIWSDEKIFTVEAVTNRQNDRLYARNAGDSLECSKSHFCHQKPTSLMVWATVASDGSKSPLIFIDVGVKINSEVYTEMWDECYPGYI
ncbi:uncharacterized protein LOC106870959 [Octopus bimaculoides]|uniref:uncharacterized protein LOC106870959 n=1 Tax=Octopus bimaculoides TaxID=37653 RepID=UPI00071E432B|nr:uncharacterized protein LOC106870959 [Octopus bimaculoides]|eukprot:XP_014772692.1 PREDICTED: uncharacterized protein LOC106870959 [Octopus bimaculoides]